LVIGDKPRFRFGFAFDRLGVQALLGLAFDHLCPPARRKVLQIYHGRFRLLSAELLLAGVDVATFSKAVELALFYDAKLDPAALV
jgi:hypothetical protein